MTFGQSIATCFSKYATFSGRASRSEYWWFYLFIVIVSIIAQIIDYLIGHQIFNLIISLAFLLPNLAVSVRRIHDSGHNGWWILCPIYNIVLMFLPSNPSENKYGAPERINPINQPADNASGMEVK